mmetsp:Transcript_79/g.192  ORF Transcript_79/g.192 Transcript_79/m.192 type:complete len:107 (-) Transcript_79:502-822(-)
MCLVVFSELRRPRPPRPNNGGMKANVLTPLANVTRIDNARIQVHRGPHYRRMIHAIFFYYRIPIIIAASRCIVLGGCCESRLATTRVESAANSTSTNGSRKLPPNR